MTRVSSCNPRRLPACLIKQRFLLSFFSSVIQFSHPVCNTIMLAGVIVCLTSVILLGLDGRLVAPEIYPFVCQARAWFLSIGFTLGYGAMFSKVWRVHRLTTKTKNNIKVNANRTDVVQPSKYACLRWWLLHSARLRCLQKKIQPWKLYSMVAGLLVFDLILLSTWQIYDPLQRSIQVFPLELPVSSDDDIKIRPELEHCESANHLLWLGTSESLMLSYYSLFPPWVPFAQPEIFLFMFLVCRNYARLQMRNTSVWTVSGVRNSQY